MANTTLFWIFSIISLVSACMVVSLSNAVYSVLFLIIVFCNTASILLLLGAEFLSFLFLIVYVGAIAVLFLFVVMMLNVKKSTVKINYDTIFLIGFFISLILFIQIWVILQSDFEAYSNINVSLIANNFPLIICWTQENNLPSNTESIGLILYTSYSLIFIMCAFILLLAMIGSIVLTMSQRKNVRKQQISLQLYRNQNKVVRFLDLRKN
uniref:NADH-ubiquinone oxidoreductase chain 6 n=1 Tax=Pyropia perforata TaxID=182771 RepID=A0A059SV35_PYRPE|nr:NADH dehydrogenase subunit 6 [Neoporphyra perforata]AHB35388.1 NADH dehydrogenase subunit 6 [Neoporphyra perforata]AHB35417.1 NADH dehydrogenase subunit 6 [Neoporphyra perforata]AIB08076.1 NADH dehydrogenase subunit 6 [Neoporphyra perforata]AIB08166.1 NADH dehydrogenase subunit 6 [Neoporphyra perforata]